MRVVGLTGSIGMGKSETARMFSAMGVPVFDADGAVHRLQSKNGPAIPEIEKAFPGVVADGVLNRDKLGKIVFGDAVAKARLEAIIHPMVADARQRFFQQAALGGHSFVVVDVPLLFETGGNRACDKVVVVTAPAAIQRERVLARPGMTEEKFTDILMLQTPDADKRAGADYIIETDKGLDYARDQVTKIVADLKEWSNQ